MEHYSATKKPEISAFIEEGMELKIVMLNKTSQTQKDKVMLVFSHR